MRLEVPNPKAGALLFTFENSDWYWPGPGTNDFRLRLDWRRPFIEYCGGLVLMNLGFDSYYPGPGNIACDLLADSHLSTLPM